VAASTYVTRKPAGCPGSATPKPSRPTVRIPAVATRATARLTASVPTVKAHTTHILTKLQLGNRTQIALLAHDAGLA
jgi:hypothetical protein